MSALTWAEVLAEPAETGSPHWFSAAYGRLAAAGDGPETWTEAEDRWRERTAPVLEARPAAVAWPDPDAVGTRAPDLVLVGERAPRGQAAFCSRSGHWLLRGLRAAGWDELRVLVTNALAPDKRRRTDVLAALGAHLAPRAASWVALGEVAGRVLRAARVTHATVPHPQWHARFQRREGPEGWARRALAAGMPAGPWIGRAMPVEPHPDARTRLADARGLPADVAYRPAPRGAGSPARTETETAHVAPAKREEARRLYVGGEAETVGAAAERVGCSADDLRAVARAEGWHAQRDEQARATTDRSLAEARRLDAKRFGQAREIATGAALAALASVARRIQSGEVVPRPGEATDLARLAIAFQGAPAPEAPADDEIARLSPREVAERILALPIMYQEES